MAYGKVIQKIKRTAKELIYGKKTYLSKRQKEDVKLKGLTKKALARRAKTKKETVAEKDRRTRISGKTISGPLSYADWTKKHGYGKTAATHSQWRRGNKR